MEELSFIKQGDQIIYLKDATGRDMLAGKQNKLKAGAGIEIAEDGTISASGWKKLLLTDVISGYSSSTESIYDIELEYYGNPALINQEFISSYSENKNSFENIDQSIYIDDELERDFKERLALELGKLPDNGLSYLFIKPIKATITHDDEDSSRVGDITSNFSFKLIYIENAGSYSIIGSSSSRSSIWNIENNENITDSEIDIYQHMVSKLLNIGYYDLY